MDVESREAAGPGNIAQAFQSGANQRAAAEAIVEKTQVVLERQTIRMDTFGQGGELAGNGALLCLLFARHAGVDGGTDCCRFRCGSHDCHAPCDCVALTGTRAAALLSGSLPFACRTSTGITSSNARLSMCSSRRELENSRCRDNSAFERRRKPSMARPRDSDDRSHFLLQAGFMRAATPIRNEAPAICDRPAYQKSGHFRQHCQRRLLRNIARAENQEERGPLPHVLPCCSLLLAKPLKPQLATKPLRKRCVTEALRQRNEPAALKEDEEAGG